MGAIATKFFREAQYSAAPVISLADARARVRNCTKLHRVMGWVRCEMNLIYWRRCRRLLGIVLCAAFAFGGTFSDCSCQYGGTTVTKTSDNNNPNANPNVNP